MKINRKSVLTTAAVLGVIALAAGGTIAYFTDKTDPMTNSFTVGDIEVNLYESQLQRQNSGRRGAFAASASDEHYCDWINVHAAEGSTIDTNPDAGPQNGDYDSAKYCTPEMDAYNTSGISAITNGHTAANRTWGYSDQTIMDDAETYQSGYLADVAGNIVPGEWVRKFAYAENAGNNDAYILIRYMIPTDYADNVEVKVPHTPYGDSGDNNFAYFTAVKKVNGEYVATNYTDSYIWTDPDTSIEYKVYAAVTNDVVKPNEMTYWSPVSALKLKNAQTESDIAPATQIDVKVDAQAVQAKTFADALTAINTGALE